METFKLLLVEDDAREIQTFNTTMERYCQENKKNIEPVVAKNLSESISILNNSFDGAIIDIKLNGDNNAGNELLGVIAEKFRIPVAVYTGTPDIVDVSRVDFKKFRRGVGYDQALDFLFEIYNTGVTKILGGRGYLEKVMNDVFWMSILPNLDTWKSYSGNGKNTEASLLRFVINHIVEIADTDVEKYLPDEMYISIVDPNILKTGSIVKHIKTDSYFIVLSPACDLVLYDNKPKTDRILLCLIEKPEDIADVSVNKMRKFQILETDGEKEKALKLQNKANEKQGITNSFPSNRTPYFHFLSKTRFFQGGIVNFRHVETVEFDDYKNKFSGPVIQISSTFTKDIVARFSSYYARQGQPEFDLG